ncbi:hypothetical protein NIES4071_108320 (plasmid) [Calothrix sp. NIES-4071]|nr:hypothetical protein NIES4071_108320 [Calothrix sp. NIES-4071]BAZ64872.1 hypothetical protein NIES4105_106050 [Calothrix sp. NIES-4105]
MTKKLKLRPGNPNFGKNYEHNPVQKGDEPLSVVLPVRVNHHLKAQLDTLPEKGEFCRDAIANAVLEASILQTVLSNLNPDELDWLRAQAEVEENREFIEEFIKNAVFKAMRQLETQDK